MSNIEWTEKTWSPITGCTKISLGCKNCYAERMSKRLAGRAGYPKDNPFKLTFHRDKLKQPEKWKKPTRIFVCSMGDLFHEQSDINRILEIFEVMKKCTHHTFILLTKRPERMSSAISWILNHWRKSGHRMPELPQNIWLGVSVENQEQADKRIPVLLQIPAAIRFVSFEPLLSPIFIEPFIGGDCICCYGTGEESPNEDCEYCDGSGEANTISWAIIGSESGARRISNEHIEYLTSQLSGRNIPVFLKQAWINNKLVKMPNLCGQVWEQMPGE